MNFWEFAAEHYFFLIVCLFIICVTIDSIVASLTRGGRTAKKKETE